MNLQQTQTLQQKFTVKQLQTIRDYLLNEMENILEFAHRHGFELKVGRKGTTVVVKQGTVFFLHANLP